MIDPIAPLGGHAPPLQCNRIVNGSTFDAPDHCGREAKWHVIWTEDLENGLCCDEHMEEVLAKWMFYARHPYRMECSMPGAVYLHDANVCLVDEDGLELEQPELAVASP